MNKKTLDTCAVLAHVLGTPIEQRDAVWKLFSKAGTIYHIPDLVISEAVHVLEARYSYSRKEVVYHLNKFFVQNEDILDYNCTLFWLVFPYYERHPALSFNDCMMAFYAQIGETQPLLTFDKALAKQHPSVRLIKLPK